jgi:hypothetical protein
VPSTGADDGWSACAEGSGEAPIVGSKADGATEVWEERYTQGYPFGWRVAQRVDESAPDAPGDRSGDYQPLGRIPSFSERTQLCWYCDERPSRNS